MTLFSFSVAEIAQTEVDDIEQIQSMSQHVFLCKSSAAVDSSSRDSPRVSVI